MRIRRIHAGSICLLLTLAILPMIGSRSEAAVGSYIVMMKEQPDPSKASSSRDLQARRRALYEIATQTASKSQAGVVAYLRQQQSAGTVSKARCFYVVNACAFTGEKAVADALAARPDVQSVSVDEVVKAPAGNPGTEAPLWHMDRIKARDAWALGFNGNGVVIGSIDTGADVSHPAIRAQYRGNSPEGWSNDYNWFDAVTFRPEPYDLSGHGTHTLGTALGGDGPGAVSGSNTDVGIAYGSRWMAAKAFDDQGNGLTSSVLLAMQWMQFPTDIFGNVRPDKAPDIVSNPWSVDAAGAPAGCRAWYSVVLKMWQMANILPVFSVGEGGAPHSPGDLPEALSVGSTDAADRKTGFSAEGSACPPTSSKPDIHAPGVSIYSSYQGGYAAKNGTSMSVPQVAGAAALMLQAAGGSGSLLVTETAQAIVAAADLCTDNAGCRKRLNVEKAVRSVQRGGVIRGTIRDAMTNAPIAGAKVSVSSPGDNDRVATTDALGGYAVYNLEAGTYGVTARSYGYKTQSAASVTLAANTTQTRDLWLSRTTQFVMLSGKVTYEQSGQPAVSATVSIIDTPLVAVTDASGNWSIPNVPDPSVPDSSEPRGYDYIVEFRASPCAVPMARQVLIKDPPQSNQVDAALFMKRDGFGYSCEELPFDWRPGTTPFPLKADDAAAPADLGFAFPFYENRVPGGADHTTRAFQTIYISTDGYIRFDGVGTEYLNGPIPDWRVPNGAVYGFWDDLYMDASSKIYTEKGSDWFTVEWRDMTFKLPGQGRLTFSVTLHMNGDIEMRYLSASGADASGKGATIGLENARGTIGFDYSYNEAVIRSQLYVYYSAAARPGLLTGTVKGSDGPNLPGAKVVAAGNGFTRTAFTDQAGKYRMRLETARPDNTPIIYGVTASKFRYSPQTKNTTLSYGITTVLDFLLNRQAEGTISGSVLDVATSTPLRNVPVGIGHPDIAPVLTDASGNFTIPAVPVGSYTVATVGSGRCRPNVSQPGVVVTAGNTSTVGLSMTSRRDGFGYRCEDFDPAPTTPVAGSSLFTGASLDSKSQQISLPFAFPIYGETKDKATISLDGYISFEEGPAEQPGNEALPAAQAPNLSLYPFWDDLVMDATSQVMVDSNSALVRIAWKDVRVKSDGSRLTVEATIYSNGNFDFRYLTAEGFDASSGVGATVGSEGPAGRWAFQYSHNEPTLRSGLLIRFVHPANSSGGDGLTGVKGIVRDSDLSGGIFPPLEGVDILIGNGLVTNTGTTGVDGRYEVELPPGSNYKLFANKSGYRTYEHPGLIVVTSSGFTEVNFQMVRFKVHTLTILVNDQLGPGNPLVDFDFYIQCPDIYADDQCARENARIPLNSGLGQVQVNLSEGSYTIMSDESIGCQMAASLPVTLTDSNPNQTVSFNVTLRRDAYGNACIERHRQRSGTGLIPLPVSIHSPLPVPLPFKFQIYGFTADLAYVYGNTGKIRFADLNDPIGQPSGPTLHVFDDHIRPDTASLVRFKIEQAVMTFEWYNVPITNDLGTPTGDRITFAAVLTSDLVVRGVETILYQYEPLPKSPGSDPTDRARGSMAKIGIRDCVGALELLFSDDPGTAVLDLVDTKGVTELLFGRRFAALGSSNGCSGVQ